MNVSDPFIRRPVGTTLLAIGLFLVGAVAYHFLPVASLPNVEFPTIRVSASRPGGDPATMAATVAAPLERRLGEISGVTEMTSASALGSTAITLQFDLRRDIDGAARDVQAALNAAAADLPGDLPALPIFRKANPAAAPILILALTSTTVAPSAIYDAADTVLAQRVAQVEGVAEVTVSGSEQPAVRVRVDPARLAAMGIGLDAVRAAIAGANATGPLGSLDGGHQAMAIDINGQLATPKDYGNVVVRAGAGAVARLSAIASVERGVRNSRAMATFNGEPAVLLIVTKQANANVIATVDRIRELLPEIRRWIPAGIAISILSDRTQTIRASVADMQLTLAATAVLVMLVVLLFLRRGPPTLAAGVTVPLSLAGTCAAMWALGFSINNVSLMALAVSVGFVVDDAIVMIETVDKRLEQGHPPMRAALEGARQIGFTVLSISVSLIAAFIPLLFMGGIVGRLFREFSVTLAAAVIVSTIVSLTVTPMICAHLVGKLPRADAMLIDRLIETALARLVGAYAVTLHFALRHRGLMLFTFLLTVGLTIDLYIKLPKGFFPQDDSGLVLGWTQAAPDISYQAMAALQQRAAAIVLTDAAVSGVGSSVGASGFNPSVNQGRLFISLRPRAERDASTKRVIARLRGKLADLAGLQVFMTPSQDLRVGARSGKSQYQFTLWGPAIDDLARAAPLVVERLKRVPGLVDVASDRESNGLEARIVIDRAASARFGVRLQDIDEALNDAFSQRQVSTIYTPRNQYRVVLEIEPHLQTDPADLSRLYVTGAGGAQVPLASLARVERTLAALIVNHQGQFPSVTISYNLGPQTGLEHAAAAIHEAVRDLDLPDSVHAEAAGDARAFAQSAGAQPLLAMAALVAVYIVLGVLYESLAHPLTIISTLPSAGLGALLALQITDTELSVIAFIGIVLLIGIVKKNGIMLVDFALDGERRRGLSPERAIHDACLARFRPILMTTLAALLGAVPLVVASGPGSELRRPLGIAIIGGLVLSQMLTLYTTPVIYLLLDRLRRGRGRAPVARSRASAPEAAGLG